jgi:hypothetical protein
VLAAGLWLVLGEELTDDTSVPLGKQNVSGPPNDQMPPRSIVTSQKRCNVASFSQSAGSNRNHATNDPILFAPRVDPDHRDSTQP